MRTPHLLASACTGSDPEARDHQAELAVWQESTRSLVEYPQIWRSLEEGAMVLGEEVDELWDEIRANHVGRARAEAAQVGAMALRFVADLYEPSGARAAARPGGRRRGSRRAERRGPAGRLFSSSHEAFGFLKREYDALWSAIRSMGPPARWRCGWPRWRCGSSPRSPARHRRWR